MNEFDFEIKDVVTGDIYKFINSDKNIDTTPTDVTYYMSHPDKEVSIFMNGYVIVIDNSDNKVLTKKYRSDYFAVRELISISTLDFNQLRKYGYR